MKHNFLKEGQDLVNRSGDLLNKIIVFLIGIFLSAIFFLFMLKLLNGMGILLALAINFALYFWLKRKYQKLKLLKSFNMGLFTFSTVTAVLAIIIYFAFFSLFQNLVS
jgi:hypothetical protein